MKGLHFKPNFLFHFWYANCNFPFKLRFHFPYAQFFSWLSLIRNKLTTILSFINPQRNIVRLGTTYNLIVCGYRCGNIAICINLTTVKKRYGVNLELNINTVINMIFFQKNKHFLLKVGQPQERPGEEATQWWQRNELLLNTNRSLVWKAKNNIAFIC